MAELKGLSKSFGDNEVLKGIDLSIERNSKTAFVGQNGQGKTTLARILVGDLDYGGKLQLGHNVQIGYFAQDQAEYLERLPKNFLSGVYLPKFLRLLPKR